MKKKKVKLTPYIFLLPFILMFCATFLYPAAYSLVLSFYKYKGYGEAKFVGIQNFKNLLTYRTMWVCLGNTAVYFIGSFIPTMLISFLLAVLIRSKSLRNYQRFYKPIVFLPQICSVVAAALIFKIIFGGDVGVINQIFHTKVDWLGNIQNMRLPVICLIAWRGIGWYFIIFLAGLTTVGEEIEEASLVDGATPFQRLRFITIPLMKPTFMLTSITYLIGSLKLYTEPNVLLSRTEAPLQVAPYVNLVTTNVNSGNFGMAAAAGWFLVVIIMGLTIVELRMFGGDE